jgi:hypothetical protein
VQKRIDYTYLDGDAVKSGTMTIQTIVSIADFSSFFLLAFVKSGSVLVNALVRDLLTECGVPLIDLPAYLFERGIEINAFQCDLAALFPLKGYCFSGFRGIPQWLIGSDVLRHARKAVVVRDPRDILVSWYYSIKYSHWFPAAGTPQFNVGINSARQDTELSLDEFCIAYAWALNAEFWKLCPILDGKDALILRYEDFVYDKVALAEEICDWCGLNIAEERIREFAAAYDVIPESDQPHAHIRQVHPGDHRRKLRPDTIAALNIFLANFLDAFSYK